MSRLWRQLAIASNWPVLAAVAVLSAAGILTLFYQSPDLGVKQLIYLAAAIACMGAVQMVSYTTIGRYAWGFYFLSLLLLIYTAVGSAVHLPGVSRINGAYAWINLGFFSLEPSEVMKISFVMVLARYLRFRSNYRSLPGLLPPFALAVVPMVLILKEPALGVAALFFPALLAMLFAAGARVKHILLILALGAALAPVFWFSGADVPVFRHFHPLLTDYQRRNLLAMFSSSQGSHYQQDQALTAMGVGGAAGKGLGNLMVSRHVPEAHNDMIFAPIGEQFGFLGSLVVLAAYVVLFAAGIEISAATREPFGRLVALGVVVLLATQTLLNLMVVMRMFPVTGVTLPFVSSGGSSLIASYIAAGLLLNIGQNRPLVIARESFNFD